MQFARIFLTSALVATSLTHFASSVSAQDGVSEEEQLLSVSIRHVTDSKFVATFTNNGSEPIRILKPLDGSYYHWIMPFYKFGVTDKNGEALGLGGRCGNYGISSKANWEKDLVLVVETDEPIEIEIRSPQYLGQTGTYTVNFTYQFEPDTDQQYRGKALEIDYPTDLWTGTVSAESIEISIE